MVHTSTHKVGRNQCTIWRDEEAGLRLVKTEKPKSYFEAGNYVTNSDLISFDGAIQQRAFGSRDSVKFSSIIELDNHIHAAQKLREFWAAQI